MIVGRDAELREVERFLGGAAVGHVLLLEGEPGIGKTTVGRATVEAATEAGFRVLGCRPAEAEAGLSFAALTDVLDGVDLALVDELPEPQRRALRVALLQEELRSPAPDPRALGMAVAGVLGSLLASSPVLVAVDDVQWLDRPSADALAFALRRVEHESLRVLLVRRTGTGNDGLAESLPRERIREVRLEGLSLAALHHLINARLGGAPARPFLLRIEELSGGNPFYALELARALSEAEPDPSGAVLPVPETLLALLGRRLDELPARAFEAALMVSAAASPTRALVLAALGSDAAPAVERAEREGVLEERRGRIRFTHPLLASAAYASASPEERRRLHRRLAALVESSEEQARHLALAAEGPEAAVADALEAAALQARARGAPSAAVELMGLCCELTPPAAELVGERRLELAHLQLSAGNAEVAQTIAESLVDELPAGPLRARALEFLAELLHVTGGAAAAARLCAQALAEAGDDPELRARIHTTTALISYDDFDRWTEHARIACEILTELEQPDPGLHSQALMALVGAEQSRDGTIRMEVVERALELERLAPPPHVADRAATGLGAWLKYAGRFDEARVWLDATYRAAIEEGDDGSLPYAVSHYPQLELWTGNWDRAAERAQEHLELAEQTGQPGQRAQALYNIAQVAAHRGFAEDSRAAAEESLAFGDEYDDDWGRSTALSVLGFLELSLDRPAEAVRAFERSFRLLDEIKSTEPRRHGPDYAEALVETGDLETAESILAATEAGARLFRRTTLLAGAARARAILLAARGDLDGALAATEEALQRHDELTVRFEQARTLLTLGKLRRRRKEKRLAKEALEEALAIFEQLGAPLWAAKARDELGRVGLRPAAPDDLTASERRIAELAASGLTNREIAQAAFVSPKTVEANLARVYRKLGIRSRAELGARMAATAVGSPPAQT